MADYVPRQDSSNDVENGYNGAKTAVKETANVAKKTVNGAKKVAKGTAKTVSFVASHPFVLALIPIAILFLCACLALCSICSVFLYTDEDCPTVFQAMRDGITTIITGQGTYEYEGQATTVSYDGSYTSAVKDGQSQAKALIPTDHDSTVVINVTPNLSEVLDNLTVYFMSVDTVIYRHTDGESGGNSTIDTSTELHYLAENANVLSDFFTAAIGTYDIDLSDGTHIKSSSGSHITDSSSSSSSSSSPSNSSSLVKSSNVLGAAISSGHGSGESSTSTTTTDTSTETKAGSTGQVTVGGTTTTDTADTLKYTGFINVYISYDQTSYREDECTKIVKAIAKEDDISVREAQTKFDEELNNVIQGTTKMLVSEGAMSESNSSSSSSSGTASDITITGSGKVDDFVRYYLGQVIDDDGAYGAQCVDGFRIYCKWLGITPYTSGNNFADGFWYSRGSHTSSFQSVTNGNYQNGDVIIWAYGSSSHKHSHISIYYNGYEFGENQGGNGGFSLIKTNFSDALGALRPIALTN